MPASQLASFEPELESDRETYVDLPPVRSRSRARTFLAIVLVYALSSLLAGPVVPGRPSETAHWKLGPVYLGRPIVTWGDPPYFLVMVNSLIEDGDLDLGNNYDQARDGDWDVGTRFRGTDLDRHVEIDREGHALSFHPPWLPAVLAALVCPLRGSEWVESACIWLTLAATLAGLGWCFRLAGFTPGWIAVLALATPLWAYARDVGTEPLHAVAWIALLAFPHPAMLAVASGAGVLLKPTFVPVPMALAAVLWWQGDRRRAAVLVGATGLALVVAIAVAQYEFRAADHFDWLHVTGNHHVQHSGGFRLRVPGFVGLLLDPQDGLLAFCPFLVLGFPALRKDARLLVPALAYFGLIATYAGWRAGSDFSSWRRSAASCPWRCTTRRRAASYAS